MGGRSFKTSSLADGPSRLDGSELDSVGAIKDSINWQIVAEKLEKAGSDEWGFENGIP